MFRLISYGIGIFLSILLLANFPVQSQPNPQSATPFPTPLRVATRIIPPFVIQEDKQLTGFSMDLWKNIAQELGVSSQISIYPTIRDLLSAVKSKKADLSIAAISITEERNRKFDFSQPIFESGLQILVRSQSGIGNLPITLLSLILSPTFFQMIGIILAMILIPAHIIWFFESRHDNGIIHSKSYYPGIFQAAWWAVSTLGAQGDTMPKGVIGRIIAVIWMFISIIFIAYFTATVTTMLTVQQLSGNIQSSDDLPGKQIATLSGSTAAAYLKQNKIPSLAVAQIDQAYEALLARKVDAVVFDAPVLLYYAANKGKGKVEVGGSIFQKENYGILFSVNSPYRIPINNVLLRLREKGIYQSLYDKWFTTK